MSAAYPTDYPLYIDNQGWPQNFHTPSYPHQYYYDNGQTPVDLYANQLQSDQSQFDNNHQHHHHHHHRHRHRPNSNYAPVIPIRRHTPGSTDPTLHQLSLQSPSLSSPPPPSPRSNPRIKFKRNPPKPQPQPPSTPIQKYTPAPLDPDERPIKPMRDTAVYYNPLSPKRTTQPKKPLATPKSVKSTPRFEFDSYRSPPPPPPSRTPVSHSTARRPIRTDLIPKTPFGISPQRNHPRRVIVEEYEDYPVSYSRPAPGKIIEYEEASGMTTRELENYEMSRVQDVIRARKPPIRTIVYHT